MGTWGAGIFDDDVALDVRATFEDALSAGLNVAEAIQKVLEELAEAVEDEDDGPVVYLALSALQLEQGEVQPDIRDKALMIIATGQGLGRWEEAGPDAVRERKQVLERLKGSLSAAREHLR
jgi:hypothetical protein